MESNLGYLLKSSLLYIFLILRVFFRYLAFFKLKWLMMELKFFATGSQHLVHVTFWRTNSKNSEKYMKSLTQEKVCHTRYLFKSDPV